MSKNAVLNFLICALSGALIGVCILFSNLGFLVFVLAVPFFYVTAKSNGKYLFRCCMTFAFSLCAVGYSPAFSIKPNLPDSLVFLIDLATYLIICLIHGFLISFLLWLGHKLPALKGTRFLYIAAFFTLAEYLIGIGSFAWPTLRISLALWQYPKLIFSASLGGQLLLCFIIIAVNALLAYSALNYKNNKGKYFALSAVLIFALNLSIGFIATPKTDKTVKVAVVQPGGRVIGEDRGTVAEEAFKTAKTVIKEKPQFIFLPESVLPRNFENYTYIKNDWSSLAKESGAQLFVCGSVDDRSVSYHFDQNGNIKNSYQKVMEVPFFENGKGDKPFRFTLGQYDNVIETKSGNVGVMICYESMFSNLSQNAVKNNADIILVQTNDSWFYADCAKDIHIAHSAYRAVESGRSLVQASLNGNTVFFDNTGNIVASIEKNKQEALVTEISTQSTTTLYSIIGEWWLFAILTVATLTSVYLKIKKTAG